GPENTKNHNLGGRKMNDNIKKAGNEIIKELEISFNPYTRVVITVDGVRIVEDLAFEPLRVSSDTTDTKQ
ncbi:hypothetical protein ACRUND_003062, partial [Listeria monocytogenes]